MVSATTPVPGRAADVFLSVKSKRAGVLKGEATAPGHDAQIRVEGFHFGISASSAVGSGRATARRQYEALRVVKRLDSATTSLLSVLATNDEIKEAKLALRKAAGGQDDFFTIVLENARVTSSSIDCDERGDAFETIEIAFTKIEVVYRKQQTSGIAGASFSFSDEILPA